MGTHVREDGSPRRTPRRALAADDAKAIRALVQRLDELAKL
jgi:hypothetical protein